MFIETVPNRTSPPAVLLRESYRDEQGRAKKRTLANLSKLLGEVVEGLRALLKGGTVIGTGPDEIRIARSWPHGHVAAVLGTLRKIALDRLILSTAKDTASGRHCELMVAMIVDRLIAPRSKLGFVRAVDEETASTSLGAVLRLGAVKEREAYEALDWLLIQQTRVENGLARRHLRDGVLMLYDVSSSYFEGRCCPLAQHGYSRDHRGDRPQIVYGLLCTRSGLPVADEVFEGNAADPSTLSAQLSKLKQRFGLSRVVLVGDRGMITSARIGEDLRPAGLDWLTCLRAPAIQALAAENGPLQLSLFDERDLAEISAPEMFPGERLIVCRNRELAAERQRKREEWNYPGFCACGDRMEREGPSPWQSTRKFWTNCWQAVTRRSCTVREMRGHLEELYGIDVSPDLISTITDAVLEAVAEWQGRPLDACDRLVFFDAIRVKIRDEGFVRNKAVYIALGNLPDGTQEILGFWIGADRGCQVLAAGDGRTPQPRRRRYPDRRRRRPEGLPRGDQRCLPRNHRADLHRPPAQKQQGFASWKDRKPIAQALRAVYRAETPDAGLAALEAFEQGPWGRRSPAIAQSWRRHWDQVIPFFAFPEGVRRIVYTTNAIEALNSQLRRAVCTRGHFPGDDAAMKLLYLVLNTAAREWKRPPREWPAAKTQFAILFGERFVV